MLARAFLYVVTSFLLLSPPGEAWSQEAVRDYFVTINDVESEQRYLGLVETHHLNKVLGFIRDDKFQYALNEIKWTLDRFPNHPRAFTFLEALAQLTQVPELPLPYYERALRDYPQYAITHAQYGKYLADIGKTERGVASLKQAIQMKPNLIAAHVWLSESYVKLGNKDLARQSAEQARTLGYTGEIAGEGPSKTKKQQ